MPTAGEKYVRKKEKREGGLHQQIWDKQVGRGAWHRQQIFTSHPVFLQAM